MPWLRLIGPALIVLMEGVGVVAAIILLARKAGGGAALALGGFGLLLASTLCSLTTELPFIQSILTRGGAGGRILSAGLGLSCLTSGLMVLGLALLISAVAALARKRA